MSSGAGVDVSWGAPVGQRLGHDVGVVVAGRLVLCHDGLQAEGGVGKQPQVVTQARLLCARIKCCPLLQWVHVIHIQSAPCCDHNGLTLHAPLKEAVALNETRDAGEAGALQLSRNMPMGTQRAQ